MNTLNTMNTKWKIVVIILALIAFVAIMFSVDSVRSGSFLSCGSTEKHIIGRGIPLYVNSTLLGSFSEKDTRALKKALYIDPAEKKNQEGWFLKDVILLYIEMETIKPETRVTVTSISRDKKAELTWKDISDPSNNLILALSKRGRLKLVSSMKGLDTREQWVQDINRIDITRP